MIGAEAHNDHSGIQRTFDATPWFEQASDEEITELAKCRFTGDYKGVKSRVNTREAMLWLNSHRCTLFGELMDSDNIILDVDFHEVRNLYDIREGA